MGYGSTRCIPGIIANSDLDKAAGRSEVPLDPEKIGAANGAAGKAGQAEDRQPGILFSGLDQSKPQ